DATHQHSAKAGATMGSEDNQIRVNRVCEVRDCIGWSAMHQMMFVSNGWIIWHKRQQESFDIFQGSAGNRVKEISSAISGGRLFDMYDIEFNALFPDERF